MHWLLLAIVLGTQIHVFTMALTGYMFGVDIKKISIGYGPKIFSNGVIVFKLLFFGGYVTFQSKDNPDKQIQPGRSFEDKNYFVRVFIALSGCFLLILVAWLLLLGPVFDELIFSMITVVEGALSPFEKGGEIISQALRFVEASKALDIFGMVFISIAAVNLLPIPILNGGQPFLELVPGIAIKEKLMMVGLLCTLAILVAWFLAIGSYFIS